MLGEVHFLVSAREARLILRRGETTIEDETWKFDRSLGRSQAADMVESAFHDVFDLMQFVVHGDP